MPQMTRRAMFMLAAGTATQVTRLYGFGSDFWNKKDPGEWSSDEIDKLVTRSPWAKQVNAASSALSRPYAQNTNDPTVGPTTGGGYPNPGGVGGGYPGGGGMGGGYPGGGMGGGGGRGGRGGGHGNEMPLSYTATVRWESAKPIQAALKTPLPEGLAETYVISVSGVPILASGRQHTDDGDTAPSTVSKGVSDEVLDRIKNLTYLEPKGKSPAQPSIVQKGPIGSSGMPTLLFGFPRDVVPLTEDDREVAFTTQLGRIEIKAKFNLKDMMYHKELAL